MRVGYGLAERIVSRQRPCPMTSRFVDLITFHGLRATTANNARGLIGHELGGVNQLELQCDLLIDPLTNLSSDRTPSYPGHTAPPMHTSYHLIPTLCRTV
jgi:hypothetical protein